MTEGDSGFFGSFCMQSCLMSFSFNQHWCPCWFVRSPRRVSRKGTWSPWPWSKASQGWRPYLWCSRVGHWLARTCIYWHRKTTCAGHLSRFRSRSCCLSGFWRPFLWWSEACGSRIVKRCGSYLAIGVLAATDWFESFDSEMLLFLAFRLLRPTKSSSIDSRLTLNSWHLKEW